MEDKLFYCYSKNLCLFLKLNGINYETKARHPNGTYYYTYKKNDKLYNALSNWNIYKETFAQMR